MTPQEAAKRYGPIRADIRRHLDAAADMATREEYLAAAAEFGLLDDDGQITLSEEDDISMLADAIVFTPDAAGSRLIDRYIAGLTEARDIAFMRRVAKAMFSVWEVVGKHPSGGIVVDDAIGRRKRRHVMDHGLGKSAPAGALLGMRLFDAGPFACGFGIVVPVSEFDAFMLRASAPPADFLTQLLYTAKFHDISAVELLVGLELDGKAA